MKTGLFFGSFNPIHIGHLVIAGYMAEFTDLDEVLFIVSPQNPLKPQQELAGEDHRLAMAKLAVGDHPKIKVSDIEFNLPRPSYTIHTLSHLPKSEYVIIMGEDSLSTFTQWKNYEEILKKHVLYVYPRKKSEKSEMHNHSHIMLINEAPVIEISATFIRQSIRQGKDVRYMLPEKVHEYIIENKIY